MTGELVVLCDFTENCSFILQDEAQGSHWNSAQATIHPFMTYFKKSVTLNTEHEDVVMVSDCLKHDSILVHTFQWHLMKYIKNTFQSRLKKMYVCDGSAARYKNEETLLNVMYATMKNSGCQQNGTSLLTSCGKSACDGVGGALKGLAEKSSLY
jgi:acyl carrier protein phosphodiesterase